MKKAFLFLFVVALMSSCVPRKDLVYLQGQPVSLKEIREINNTPYKLQVHDIINIDFKSDPDDAVKLFQKSTAGGAGNIGGAQAGGLQSSGYFNGFSVDVHGNIRLPYIGEMNVLGYTTVEVRKKIEEKIQEYVGDDTEVFVTVKLDGIRYTIMGEVGSPGPKIIFQNRVSIIDAITNAGDVQVVGNRKNVEVIRTTPGGVEKFEIDLTQIDALNSEIFYIKPNDYINVKPLKQKSWGTGTTGLQSLSTIVSVFTLVTSTILIVRGL